MTLPFLTSRFFAVFRQRLLTRFQANTILCHQRLRRKRIGGYFVKNGYLTEAKMEELLIHFEKFNRQFRPGRFRGMPKK